MNERKQRTPRCRRGSRAIWAGAEFDDAEVMATAIRRVPAVSA